MRRSRRTPGSLRCLRHHHHHHHHPLAPAPEMRELRPGRGARTPRGVSPARLIKEERGRVGETGTALEAWVASKYIRQVLTDGGGGGGC